MAEDPPLNLTKKQGLLFGLLTFVLLFVMSFVVESCDTEKVEVCDVASGTCDLESQCRPLILDLFS